MSHIDNNNLEIWFLKYIKYKNKYLQLKKLLEVQTGGKQSNKELFAEKEGVDYDKLIVTEEGEYSITKRKDGEELLKIIKSVVKSDLKEKIITDLTGNVGGDTILFGLNFKEVRSIEYNKENFDALENNVKVFGLNNITLYYGDSTKIYDWETDILYLDPPWGGSDYKSKIDLDLYLGDVRVDEFVKEVLERDNRPTYIFMKLPRNYNFKRLYDINKSIKIRINKYKIRGYIIILIK